jgi:hypothetical protein
LFGWLRLTRHVHLAGPNGLIHGSFGHRGLRLLAHAGVLVPISGLLPAPSEGAEQKYPRITSGASLTGGLAQLVSSIFAQGDPATNYDQIPLTCDRGNRAGHRGASIQSCTMRTRKLCSSCGEKRLGAAESLPVPIGLRPDPAAALTANREAGLALLAPRSIKPTKPVHPRTVGACTAVHNTRVKTGERLGEGGGLLAGLRRFRVRQSSSEFADFGNSSLDCVAHQRGDRVAHAGAGSRAYAWKMRP